MQIIFQLIMTTDGRTSFAIFNYEYQQISGLILTPVQIGFNSGDQVRLANFNPIDVRPNQNRYRIDGKITTN